MPTETKSLIKLSNDITVTMVDGKLTWNEVLNAHGYAVHVDDNIYEIQYNYFELKEDGGTYSVKIVALGDNKYYFNSSPSVANDYNKLDRPVLSYSEGVLSWQNVSNASYYEVSFNHMTINVGSDTTFVLDLDEISSNRITVKAVGNSEYLSTKSYEQLTVPMGYPEDTIDDNTIIWGKTFRAMHYILTINDETHYFVDGKTSYELGDAYSAGTYDITIAGIIFYNGYLCYSVTKKTVTKLETVQNIREENGYITWDPVEGATKYEIKVGTSNYYSETPFYYGFIIREEGLSEVSVRAMNDDGYHLSSINSSVVELNIINKLNYTIKDSVFEWDEVLNAKEYEVIVNGQEITTTNTFFYLDDTYDAGNYTIQIRAVANEGYISSGLTERKTFEKLEIPLNMRIEGGYLRVDELVGAAGYRVEINGVTYDYDDSYILMPKDITSNRVDIRVIALGDNITTLNSEYNEVDEFRVLLAPELTFTGDTLYWTRATSGEDNEYYFYIDGLLMILLGKTYSYSDIEEGVWSYINNGSRHEIYIREIGTSTRLSSVPSNSYYKLEKPVITSSLDDYINNKVITWNKVEGAQGYKLIIDNDEIILDKNTLSYNVSEITTLNIKMQAIGQDNYFDSELNEMIFVKEGEEHTFVYFGKYPQTVVEDEALISQLNLLSSTNSNGYYVYNGSEYAKLVADPYDDYKPVMFNNGERIIKNKIYYFKVEPIKWRVLKQENGELMLVSEFLLDKQQYYPLYANRTIDGKTIYPNNYEHSSIRTWLNDDFYNKAFNSINKTYIKTSLVDNSASTTESNINPYVSNDTYDKVYLLSYQEVENIYMNAVRSRDGLSTDYAKAKHLSVAEPLSFSPGYTSGWWLRSPSDTRYGSATQTNVFAAVTDEHSVVYYDDLGVRPVINININ